MLDLPCPAEDIGISYSVFGALFDIAEKYATNRNNAILEMVRKITTLPDINIKSTVRKYQKKKKTLQQMTPWKNCDYSSTSTKQISFS